MHPSLIINVAPAPVAGIQPATMDQNVWKVTIPSVMCFF